MQELTLTKKEVESLYKLHQEEDSEFYTLYYSNSSGIGQTLEVMTNNAEVVKNITDYGVW